MVQNWPDQRLAKNSVKLSYLAKKNGSTEYWKFYSQFVYCISLCFEFLPNIISPQIASLTFYLFSSQQLSIFFKYENI